MLPVFRRILLLAAVAVLVPVTYANAEAHRLADDPGATGHYTVGHTSYSLVDKDNGNRPVYLSVWYPAEARTIHSSTPPAQYPLDPYYGALPLATSTDFEALGFEPAYEGLKPSDDRPFPLVMFSPGWGCDYWLYLYIGTRLASHGYVVAVLEHWSDWTWDGGDTGVVTLINRPRDASFAITQLLQKTAIRGELLHRTIDASKIAMGGHSLGGYATFALTAGDTLVCDEQFGILWWGDPAPNPATTCVPTIPDRRIKAMITLDGSSQVTRFREFARIQIPSLIMGEMVEYIETATPDLSLRTFLARPHAAINRPDSYRADVNNMIHMGFTDICDGIQVMHNLNVISDADLPMWEGWYDCAGDNPPTIPAAEAYQVVTKYMIAFLDTHLRGEGTWLDRAILTPQYALDHLPKVQFFNSERCDAVLPDKSFFRYRPHQVSGDCDRDSDECEVAQKDPTGWFAPPATTSASASTQLLRSPVPGGRPVVPMGPLVKPPITLH
jgi:dienelactone hydrolase